MRYVFDTGIFINMFRHYYRDRFPTLWEKFASAVADKTIIATSEVFKELSRWDDAASAWAKKNKPVFPEPTRAETDFVARIFREHPHFQQLIANKARLEGHPCADPFVITLACVENRCVVTTEIYKESAAKIPNVCKEYSIGCTDLEGFMELEEWKF